MPNVTPIGATHVPVEHRVVEELDIEDFSVLLEAGAYLLKSEVNGLTILHYPRMIAICPHGGIGCTVIRQTGTNFEAYIADTLAELDAIAA